jgi:hypothetical protein
MVLKQPDVRIASSTQRHDTQIWQLLRQLRQDKVRSLQVKNPANFQDRTDSWNKGKKKNNPRKKEIVSDFSAKGQHCLIRPNGFRTHSRLNFVLFPLFLQPFLLSFASLLFLLHFCQCFLCSVHLPSYLSSCFHSALLCVYFLFTFTPSFLPSFLPSQM